MPLFGKSHKSPQELVKILREALLVLEKGDKKIDKASEDISKTLGTIKNLLCGSGDQEPQPEVVAQLAQEIYNANLFFLLIKNLSKIDFESKKDVTQIVNNLLRRQIGTRFPTVEQICNKKEILTTLLNGYESQDIALNCGMMLRECLRHEPLTRIILHSPEFYNFFAYVEVPTFDIASDAFATFKDLLTRHKFLASEFLEANYDKVFTHYQNLLISENYVTRRQSLKLLGELILDRHNFNVMTRYISNPENLKLMMNLLKDKSRNIQFEAFHVFKVFVANPNKTKAVADILLRNRDRLVEFLSKFQNDRTDDEQFNDEKAYLIKQIKELKVSSCTLPISTVTSSTVNSNQANLSNVSSSSSGLNTNNNGNESSFFGDSVLNSPPPPPQAVVGQPNNKNNTGFSHHSNNNNMVSSTIPTNNVMGTPQYNVNNNNKHNNSSHLTNPNTNNVLSSSSMINTPLSSQHHPPYNMPRQ